MGAYDQYGRLSDAERSFIWSHPFAAMDFREAADKALNQAAATYPRETLHNGTGDAFRHCYWNALMTREQGADLAREFANAHETGGGPAIEGRMDLHNNAVGRRIGAAHTNASDGELAAYCVAALDNDELLIIDGGVLVRSDSRLPAR